MIRGKDARHAGRWRASGTSSAGGWVGFSVSMAHRLTAGADLLLMPSRFEPCGLNQLYAHGVRHRADRACGMPRPELCLRGGAGPKGYFDSTYNGHEGLVSFVGGCCTVPMQASLLTAGACGPGLAVACSTPALLSPRGIANDPKLCSRSRLHLRAVLCPNPSGDRAAVHAPTSAPGLGLWV